MTDSNDVIQKEVISELKEILADEFPMLVTTYLQDANERMDRLQSAIASDDAPNIKIEAHSLKGSSINLGATGLADLFAQMENCGANEELDGLSGLFTKIQSEFSVAEDFLKQQLS